MELVNYRAFEPIRAGWFGDIVRFASRNLHTKIRGCKELLVHPASLDFGAAISVRARRVSRSEGGRAASFVIKITIYHTAQLLSPIHRGGLREKTTDLLGLHHLLYSNCQGGQPVGSPFFFRPFDDRRKGLLQNPEKTVHDFGLIPEKAL
jgi:hypothetical protein